MENSYVPEGSREADLLVEIAESEGFESVDALVEYFALRSVQPGACECFAVTTRVEPDQREGWCHNCEGQGVKSVGVLAGLC